MSRVALIPARGGSKRLPRKNILQFNGKPMISYPIESALRSSLFEDVFVSTEDSETADVAVKYGAKVVDRPVELATDTAMVNDVCRHFLDVISGVELFCCVYATAVRLRPDTIVKAFHKFETMPRPDFVMGVSKYIYPPYQALVNGDDGYLRYMWSEWKGVQSQNYPELLVSNGSFYWARTTAFLKSGSFYGDKLVGYLVPEDEVSDINTIDDLNRLRSESPSKAERNQAHYRMID